MLKRAKIETGEERLLTLLNAMADAAIETDEKGVVTLYNGATLGLLNTHRDIRGEPLDKVLPLATEGGQKIDFSTLVEGNPPSIMRNDLVISTNDQTVVNLELAVSPIRISDNGKTRVEGYILVLRDITYQHQLDEERDEFISVVSHELRTPVAIAEANLSTALMPKFSKLDPRVESLLEQAHDNMIFLGELIRDLTTLSRAQRSDMRPNLKLLNLGELMSTLWRDYRASATSRGVTLRYKAPTPSISIVSGEEEIREIMQNLITNAIKYTEQGAVTLNVERSSGGAAALSVHDDGVGISAADQKRVFSKFYRSEDPRIRKTSGTGLGLYISRRLAERLGATIELESKLNQGSTFRLVLPQRGIDE
jgi:signal transduction histidine kinase